LVRFLAKVADFTGLECSAKSKGDTTENLDADHSPSPFLLTIGAERMEAPDNESGHDEGKNEHESVHTFLRFRRDFKHLKDETDHRTNQDDYSRGTEARSRVVGSHISKRKRDEKEKFKHEM